MNKKGLATIGVIILIFSLYLTYQAGFNRGEKTGFQLAYQEAQDTQQVTSSNQISGIISEISDSEVVIVDSDEENYFEIDDTVKVKREIDISPSEFDNVEREYISKRREVDQAERVGEVTDKMIENFEQKEDEFQKVLDLTQKGYEEIAISELSQGDLITLTIEDNFVTKIKTQAD